MTRLVHLAGYSAPQTGSFIPFMCSVLSEARNRGWGVEAVFPADAASQPWVDGLQDAEIGVAFATGSRRWLARWLLDRIGDGTEPTVLHTHFTAYDVPAALAARARPDLNVYWHIHTVLSNRPLAIAGNALKFSLLGRYVDRILTPSDDVARELIRRFAKREKVSVFPNAIDPDAFPIPSQRQRESFRRELGISENHDVLLHFGRDWQLKGGDFFLDALAVLLEQGRSVIGIVNQGGEEARRAAQLRGVEENVRLVGLTQRPQQLYGAADVLVSCSHGEGMPFAVIEALCSGVPVVASDLAGHRHLGDRLDACTIVPHDSARIAAAVSAYLDADPSEAKSWRAAARSWVEEQLGLSVAVERLLDDYEQTIASPSGQSED
jgi:glycosyltransferase involved in cell wall biosynthesis